MGRPDDNAFPQTAPTQWRDASGEMHALPAGMTIREYVATQTLPALISTVPFRTISSVDSESWLRDRAKWRGWVAQEAVRIADALIEECGR